MTQTRTARLEPILLVAIGGFAGANLRYLVDTLVPASLLATATVNVFGSFALGVVFYEDRFSGRISAPTRRIVATGFLSSFTTYSTFVVGAVTATPVIGLCYVAGSYALGFLGVLVGRALVRPEGGGR
ncbi:chromosome condensation protein CrcB [Halovenus sp. WSH3]|uniref:Fluoride-specific ion channel FluC n=1 Tax=Halovenus carboxidivorans TaxID=2692199 RepID=A0A6B0T8U5_9EURY|nr:CrcB family protein [Halovenus carboxidivorans]MXR51661.1 chromosome condensation protein CrcB [Halovenus carboxidivorans]